MEKYLFNSLEEGGIYQLRTSEFQANTEFKSVLSDFDQLYESYQNSPTLFNINDGEKISLTADTYSLTFYAEGIDIYNQEEREAFFKNLGISNLTVKILSRMIDDEDFSVATIVEMIAKPGQKINIQMTDTLYGNSEYDMET